MKKLKDLKKFVSKETASDEIATKKTYSLKHHNTSFLCPVDYKLPDILESYINNFHNKTKEYAEQCNIDRFNVNMMDADIESVLRLCLDDLAKQRQQHSQAIAKLKIYQEVELQEMRSKLETLKKERREKQLLLDRLTEKEEVNCE